MWHGGTLSRELFEGSLATYDAFYDALAPRLDALAERGPFVLLDVHSYNHRRDGADADPAPGRGQPRGQRRHRQHRPARPSARWSSGSSPTSARPRPACDPVDARENVSFEGRALAWFVHDRYPGVGCVLALEFKKTWMDEWTAEVDDERLSCLRAALAGTLPGLHEELERLR